MSGSRPIPTRPFSAVYVREYGDESMDVCYDEGPWKETITLSEPGDLEFDLHEEYTSDTDDDDDDYSSVISNEDSPPLSPHLDPSLWSTLPPEIKLTIQRPLIATAAQDGGDKRTASKLSLVSREWSLHLRPRLFQNLRLASASDISTLSAMLHSATSGWLRDHILAVVLTTRCRPTARVFRTLQHLRGLRHLQILCPPPPPPPLSSLQPQPLLTRSVCSRRTFRTLYSLQLRGCAVRSQPALLRMLGDAACLQSLALEHVSWRVSGSGAAPPTTAPCVVRPGLAFRHLRHLDVVACTDNLALSAAVLSAAVATGGGGNGGTLCFGGSHERA